MNEHIEFKHEGQSFEELQKSKDQDNKDGAAAEPEKKDPAENGGAGDGAEPKPKPFNEDPEVQSFIDRQVEKRLGDVEKKHQEDLTALRGEIAAGKKPDITAEKPPRWFGGKQDQWEEFQTWFNGKTAPIGEGVITTLAKTRQQEEQAVQEATNFMTSELAAIQSDKTLNPKGIKIDPKELLQVVVDNELIDTKGRWNYRAGWRILRPTIEAKTTTPAADPDRKKIAAAGVKNDNGGTQGGPKPFKTSADFAKKKPW